MAWFTYKCDEHGNFRVVLDKASETLCPKCGSKCNRILRPSNACVVEYVDTGFQARRVEWLKDQDELLNERSAKYDKKVEE